MGLFIRKKDEKVSTTVKTFNSSIILVLLVVGIVLALKQINVNIDFMGLWPYRLRILSGLQMTLYISAGSLVLSLIIGVLVVAMKQSRIIILNSFANIYVTLIRGTPLISQIYLFYYIVGTALGINDRVFAGIIILSIFEGAYIAEIIRGSILSLDKQQLEIAKVIGLNKTQTLTNVVLPQLIARTLPSLTGQFASIVKDSSLLSVISIIEITHIMTEITATDFQFFEAYLLLAGLYLLFTLPMSFITTELEKRFSYAHKA